MNRRQLLQGISAGGLLGAAKFTQAESVIAMPEQPAKIEVVASMSDAEQAINEKQDVTNDMLCEINCHLCTILAVLVGMKDE